MQWANSFDDQQSITQWQKNTKMYNLQSMYVRPFVEKAYSFCSIGLRHQHSSQ